MPPRMFEDLIMSRPVRTDGGRARALPVSLVFHGLAVGVVITLPALTTELPPVQAGMLDPIACFPRVPVVAVASGTVVSVTYDGSNGRMVRLRHGSAYQTYYLHLSRFAAGIRAGGHVDQGDVIGYVGSTGLATGPHLHFGLTKNGAFVNPIAEHR